MSNQLQYNTLTMVDIDWHLTIRMKRNAKTN